MNAASSSSDHMANVRPDLKPQTIAAMEACVAHGRALLESAKTVQASGHPNIAYHLAALCLEEVGRRSLLGVQSLSEQATVPPAWPKKHEQDHVKKLFWAIFGPMFLGTKLTAERFQEMNALATHIHQTRLLGLYVGNTEDGLTIPADQIGAEDCKRLIDFAETRLGLAASETFRDEVPQEYIDLQAWLLTSFEDSEKRKGILSAGSLEKFAELKDVRAWVRWLKDLFDKAEADSRAAAQREIERSNQAPDEKTKDKWQIRVRIVGASHSIRPKVLTAWNKGSNWIKLSAGADKKELLIDFILGDNVPVQPLWYFGWGVARQFVTALNMGTMGFWWWHMPQHVDRWFESLRDLETGQELRMERKPSSCDRLGRKSRADRTGFGPGRRDFCLAHTARAGRQAGRSRLLHRRFNFPRPQRRALAVRGPVVRQLLREFAPHDGEARRLDRRATFRAVVPEVRRRAIPRLR